MSLIPAGRVCILAFWKGRMNRKTGLLLFIPTLQSAAASSPRMSLPFNDRELQEMAVQAHS